MYTGHQKQVFKNSHKICFLLVLLQPNSASARAHPNLKGENRILSWFFGTAHLPPGFQHSRKPILLQSQLRRTSLLQVWCLFLSLLCQISYFILLWDLMLGFPFCFSKGLIVHSKINISLPWLRLDHFASICVFKTIY